MKIVIAPDSFKESMTALQVCNAVEKGVLNVKKDVEIIKIPMADGGEGTAEILKNCYKAQIVKTIAHDAYHRKVNTYYYEDGYKAVIEIATICGLESIMLEDRNPIKSTTYGLGELINESISRGNKEIIICLGGSATNDGGIGMLDALGVIFYDEKGLEVHPTIETIKQVKSFDFELVKQKLASISLKVAVDVENPFCGISGASRVFAKQKGANPQQIDLLENNMKYFNTLVYKETNLDLEKTTKTGAAGGVSGALLLIGATLQSGIELVINETALEKHLMDADICISGEGSIDSQTANGKTLSGVAKLCQKHDVKLIAFGGRVETDLSKLYEIGLLSAFSIVNEAMPLENALKNGSVLLEKSVENVMKIMI